MSPSWVELVGRNAAAEAVSLSGTLVVTEMPGEQVFYDFHHAPGRRWRIEQNGLPVYLSGTSRTVVRIDDQMQLLGGDFSVVGLGTHLSPLDLVGDASMLRMMSRDVRPIGDAAPVEFHGRTAWSVPLASPGGATVHVAIDDATGFVSRVSDDNRVLLALEEVEEHAALPESLFEWDGPVADPPTSSRRGAGDGGVDERIAFTRAMIDAQARATDVITAIVTADSESAARTALIDLLGVTGEIADGIAAAPLTAFRADIAASTRRTLRTLQGRRDD